MLSFVLTNILFCLQLTTCTRAQDQIPISTSASLKQQTIWSWTSKEVRTEEVQVWLFVTWWLRFRFEMDQFADCLSILEVTISCVDSLLQGEKRMCEVSMILFHDYSQHQRWYLPDLSSTKAKLSVLNNVLDLVILIPTK